MEHDATKGCALCGSTDHNRSACRWRAVAGDNPTPLLVDELKRRERIAQEQREWHQKRSP